MYRLTLWSAVKANPNWHCKSQLGSWNPVSLFMQNGHPSWDCLLIWIKSQMAYSVFRSWLDVHIIFKLYHIGWQPFSSLVQGSLPHPSQTKASEMFFMSLHWAVLTWPGLQGNRFQSPLKLRKISWKMILVLSHHI